MTEFRDLPIIDCHVHIRETMDSVTNLEALLAATGFSGMTVVSASRLAPEGLVRNSLGLLFKALHPEQVYFLGALQYPLPDLADGQPGFAEQVERLSAMGADGIKMIQGKPTVYKQLGHSLDDGQYTEYYQMIEARGLPILFHVADPETFWDEALVPARHKERGWFYGDGTFPTKETLYAEIDHILERFPRLRIIFAHFYFLSADPERAGRFLDRWPQVSYDLTPGWEMYHNFSLAPATWRDFFRCYADRILLGTDNSGGVTYPDTDELAKAQWKIRSMRAFLETEETFDVYDRPVHGIALDEPILRRIYRDNLIRYMDAKPCAVNLEQAIAEAARVQGLARQVSPDQVYLTATAILERLQSLAK